MATALDSLKCRVVATSPSLGPNSRQLSNLPTLLRELSPSTSEFALITPSASAQYENSTYSPHQLPATPPLAEDFPLLPKAIQHQSRSPDALPPEKTAKPCLQTQDTHAEAEQIETLVKINGTERLNVSQRLGT